MADGRGRVEERGWRNEDMFSWSEREVNVARRKMVGYFEKSNWVGWVGGWSACLEYIILEAGAYFENSN